MKNDKYDTLFEVDNNTKIISWYKVDWLLDNCDLEDDVWLLKENLKGQEKSRMTVSWNSDHYDDCMGNWTYWRDYGKKVAFWIMESPATECSTTGTLALYAREIRAICEWLCFERSCINIETVTTQDVVEYENYLKSLNLKVNTILTKLILLRSFRLLKSDVGEGLIFDPYLLNGSIKSIAKKVGVKSGHTKTIYPREVFNLINFSLEQLKQADKVIDNLNVYIETSAKYTDVAGAYKRRLGKSSKDMDQECRVLYGSALIVILALLGERKHELSEGNETSVIEILEGRAQEIVGREFKTSKNKAGKETVRPVINEVRAAFEVIEKLTMHIRRDYDGSAFFLRLPLTHNSKSSAKQFELVTGVMYRLLDKAAESAGYVGKLRPHMFRRSFSMLWAWRYEVGDLYQLSKILHHNSEVFTNYYTEDEDVWQFLPEPYQRLTFEIIEQSLLGKRNLIGGFSTALKRYSRLLRGKVKVLTPERASAFARTLMERTKTIVIPNADGYCFMSTARGTRAKCSIDGQGPNYANRSEELCTKCPNFASDESRSEYWQKRHDAHEAVYKSTDINMVKIAALKGMNTSSRYISEIPCVELIDEC